MNIAYNITGTGKISAFIEGKAYSVETDHPRYKEAIEAIRAKDGEAFIKVIDIAETVRNYVDGQFSVIDGVVSYAGYELHNTLTDRIVSFLKNDLPVEPLVNFLKNLMRNPSKRAVDELYTFLDYGDLPITEDGCFLAFKNVREDFKDVHSGKFDNTPGQSCSMPRNMVDEDKARTCSQGLHFCSIKYLPSFGDSTSGKTVVLKINPRDVVAIPADYNNTKGRCCQYEVVSEYTDNWREKLDKGENGFESGLYTDSGEAYTDDDDNDDDDTCSECGYHYSDCEC